MPKHLTRLDGGSISVTYFGPESLGGATLGEMGKKLGKAGQLPTLPKCLPPTAQHCVAERVGTEIAPSWNGVAFYGFQGSRKREKSRLPALRKVLECAIPPSQSRAGGPHGWAEQFGHGVELKFCCKMVDE